MNPTPPIHDENDPRLTALVLGELTDAERDALLAHDDGDAARFANLEAELRDLSATAARVQQALRDDASDGPDLGDEVRAQILQAIAAPRRQILWGRVQRRLGGHTDQRPRQLHAGQSVFKRRTRVVAAALSAILLVSLGLAGLYVVNVRFVVQGVQDEREQEALVPLSRTHRRGDLLLRADRLSLDVGIATGGRFDRAYKVIMDDHPHLELTGKQTLTVWSNIAAGRFARDARLYRLYAAPKQNTFLAAATQPISTFSADVDTASYATVRDSLHNFALPPPGAVRLEELVNYFHFGEAWFDGEPLRTATELTTSPWLPHRRILSVRVQARSLAQQNRPASNLVFLVDVSGSMRAPNRLPLVQAALRVLVDQLQPQDRVAIVTYAGEAGVRLQPTAGDRKQEILNVINHLDAGGSTHGSAGIAQAYALARANLLPQGNNRVILATDGDLNVGVTDPEDLAQLVEREAKSGVFLTALGFGITVVDRDDERLEKLADRGNGVYAHIDSLAEARRVLGTQVQGALFTVAKDLKIQVEFNPHIVASYRLLGYDNRRLANADFANDAKDAGDVGAGHTVTALYEIEPVGAELLPAAATATTTLGPGELARVRLRYKEPQGQTSQLVERSVAAKATPFATASADLRFAYGVAAFAMLLQRHLPAAGMSWEQVRPIIAAAVGTDAERHALLSLFDDARQIAGAPEVH